MPAKVSARLQHLLDRGRAGESIPLNISIKRSMSAASRDASIEEVRQFAVDQRAVEYIPISNTVHCRVPLTHVPQIIDMPHVEWVDVEKEATIEELLD